MAKNHCRFLHFNLSRLFGCMSGTIHGKHRYEPDSQDNVQKKNYHLELIPLCRNWQYTYNILFADVRKKHAIAVSFHRFEAPDCVFQTHQ